MVLISGTVDLRVRGYGAARSLLTVEPTVRRADELPDVPCLLEHLRVSRWSCFYNFLSS